MGGDGLRLARSAIGGGAGVGARTRTRTPPTCRGEVRRGQGRGRGDGGLRTVGDVADDGRGACGGGKEGREDMRRKRAGGGRRHEAWSERATGHGLTLSFCTAW